MAEEKEEKEAKKKEKEEKEEDKEDKDFKNFFTDMGHLFEKRIIEYLVDTYGIDSVKQICEQNEIYGLNDIISLSKQTIKLIEEKTPIIVSAPIVDFENKTYGIIDLIIRTDYFIKMFEKSDNFSSYIDCSDYIVVDIKWKKLEIIKKCFLSGSIKFKHYKSQVYIYTTALKNTFKTNSSKFSNYSAILGKGCSFTESGNKIVKNNPFFTS